MKFGVRRGHDERPRANVDAGHLALDNLRAEPFGLRPHLAHELRTHDAVAIPGEILHERRQHELTAGFDAFNEKGLQVGARGVESGGQAGRA